MMRSITQALAVVCLLVAPGAAAQLNCVHRFKSWEPQRTSIAFLKGHPELSPPTLHVAGGVATTLVFDKVEVGSAAFAGEAGSRFRTLEVGKHVVVLIPKQDLADGEHLSLMVTLKDGTEVPFDLVPPLLNRGSDGQVDVSLNEDDVESLRRALQLAREENEALGTENLQYLLESESPEYALATLLAQGKTDHTPFVDASQKAMNEAGTRLVVTTFRRRSPKLDVGKTAVVFQVTNRDPKALWRFDEVRLMSATTGESKSFAVRAFPHILSAGQTGRIAVVFDSNQFGTGPDTDHLLLELWRADGIRQAYVELERSDDDARLVSVTIDRSRAP